MDSPIHTEQPAHPLCAKHLPMSVRPSPYPVQSIEMQSSVNALLMLSGTMGDAKAMLNRLMTPLFKIHH